MYTLKKFFLAALLICAISEPVFAQGKNILQVEGTGFVMNNEPFEYTGVSFFNALYNKEFTKDSETRRKWIRAFKETGINVLRVWCQWDNANRFIDAGEGKTLYHDDGSLKPELVSRLHHILTDADAEGTVILLVLFSRESWKNNLRLSDEASNKAVTNLSKELLEHRNLVFQVWNEYDYRAIDYLKLIKSVDPERLVTNSPGYSGNLGTDEENRVMDFLSPHTTRDDNRHWEIASEEIGSLLARYRKPVVDDEPARKGTPKFGGPKSPTSPNNHILHMYNIWKAGGYVIYHHDMFQTGYGSEAVPENGIPAPGFSAYHDQVYDFLSSKQRYLKLLRK